MASLYISARKKLRTPRKLKKSPPIKDLTDSSDDDLPLPKPCKPEESQSHKSDSPVTPKKSSKHNSPSEKTPKRKRGRPPKSNKVRCYWNSFSRMMAKFKSFM